MAGSPAPLLTLPLPGLGGTGQLFSRFLGAANGALEFRALSYSRDVFLGYDALEELVRRELPGKRRFALLGESFSGPIALRIAAKGPPGLVAVVLATTFHRRPARLAVQALWPLAPLFFRMPLPPHVVRLLLAGTEAPWEGSAIACSEGTSRARSVRSDPTRGSRCWTAPISSCRAVRERPCAS